MPRIDPERLSEAIRSKRFLALDRAGADVDAIATWDDRLLRDMRLLVPIDLQALFVPRGGAEPMVRLPMLLAGEGAEDTEAAMPPPFEVGTPRPPGVHLHWAMPDALLRGRLEQRDPGSANRLGLPPLPDRWVVLRIVLPRRGREPDVRGWVLEADRAVAVPLEEWGEGSDASRQATPAGVTVAPDELTGTVGGSVTWAGVYDAVLNRFAFHDPLDDLGRAGPAGVDQRAATYVVAGWWSDPAADPLDAARSSASFAELLDGLRWRLLGDRGESRSGQLQRSSKSELRKALGLETRDRFGEKRLAAKGGARAPGTPAAFSPLEETVLQRSPIAASSKFTADAFERYVTEPWHLRSSLLHGVVYGVPVTGAVAVDSRPAGAALRVAIGRHDDDVVAALASVPGAPASAREDTERLLAAFTAQKLNRFGSPEGAVEVEEHRHAAAFASLPGGTAGTDRFLSGAREGTQVPRRRRSATTIDKGKFVNPKAAEARLVFSRQQYDLVRKTEREVHETMRDAVEDEVLAADPRVVARPAPRFAFPVDPLVAVQGARRSLRHGGDGRASPDGKLTCRWPTQVIGELQGVVRGDQLVRSLGSGAVPDEIVLLAREAVLHDPYHVAWLTAASAPRANAGLVRRRLTAEAAMRFGRDGTYDGATRVLAGKSGGFERRWVADELHRFSIVKGVDPDPVGVTAWSQPWVPLWLEWEVEVATPAEPSLDGWSLADVDLERDEGTAPAVAPRTFQGRTLLTTGAATTLRRAVLDWLAAEDARDVAGSGEASEETETALRNLAAAVAHVDVLTATLDGLRYQLLGLPTRDGLQRATDGNGGIAPPAPAGPPTLLVGGHTRLTRARLLDAFARAVRQHVAVQVNLADEGGVLAALHGLAQHASIDQVECLWEPYMILAARIRESFGLPGMTVEQTLPFRDKELMKQKIDTVGIRTPWHVSATTVAEVWEAAERVGYPLIVKPIAGAGSADTYRVDSAEELADVLPLLRHVPEVSVEEFIDGEEFTYDTVCAGGSILYENIMWYRPRPLQMKMHEWISPSSIALNANFSIRWAVGLLRTTACAHSGRRAGTS